MANMICSSPCNCKIAFIPKTLTTLTFDWFTSKAYCCCERLIFHHLCSSCVCTITRPTLVHLPDMRLIRYDFMTLTFDILTIHVLFVWEATSWVQDYQYQLPPSLIKCAWCIKCPGIIRLDKLDHKIKMHLQSGVENDGFLVLVYFVLKHKPRKFKFLVFMFLVLIFGINFALKLCGYFFII